MEFLGLYKKKDFFKEYITKDIEKDKLERILEAGNNAPTETRKKAQRIYVIKDKEGLEKVDKITNQRYNAPIVIMTCYDKNEIVFTQSSEYSSVDALIAHTQMKLEAYDLRLGSLRGISFEHKKAIEIFHLPKNIVPVALLPIGYNQKNVKVI